MPCRSEYMEPFAREVEASKVFTFLDELLMNLPPNDYLLRGYHPEAYCKNVSQERLDAKTQELCNILKNTDVKNYSLELQIWWRDHQKWDKEREEKELLSKSIEEQRKAALAKLTPKEREILQLKT